MIKHDSKAKTYTLYSKDGSKRLGTYKSREAAVAREKQVNFFKSGKAK